MWIKRTTIYLLPFFSLFSCENKLHEKTEITRWPHDRKGAVSITYDDGIRTQFSRALPIMEELKLPATFFIITGPITGSSHHGQFIGRPVKEIISESAQTSTVQKNFFERASAARYLGFKGALDFYNRADSHYERGKQKEAYSVLDSLYGLVRKGILPVGKDTSMEIANEKGLTWEAVRQYAAKGYEFASHSVTHAHLAILDTTNMLYELEKSKEDILEHLGPKYGFSAEVPFGIEDPRVMKTAFSVYPALRNSMPDSFMDEINRGNKTQPGKSTKEYVQWQRGPLSRTPLSFMQSWIDTTLAHDDIWLVLVFHGVDSLGWEPLPHQTLNTYFNFINDHRDRLWVASFGDIARYIRERMHTNIEAQSTPGKIEISLHTTLDTSLYNVPLTLKTTVPAAWDSVSITQGNYTQALPVTKEASGRYVLYQAKPGANEITLSPLP